VSLVVQDERHELSLQIGGPWCVKTAHRKDFLVTDKLPIYRYVTALFLIVLVFFYVLFYGRPPERREQ
jgi:hypothetical protein